MSEVFIKTTQPDFELDNPLTFCSIVAGPYDKDTPKEWLWYHWEDDGERVTMDSLNRTIGEAQGFLDALIKLRDNAKNNCGSVFCEPT